MILGTEVREERRRRVAAQATSCQDGQKGRPSLGCACDIACACERLLVENLDGACMQTARARASEVLVGAPLDDGDVDARQRQLARQHQPRRTPAGDHHRVLGHRHAPAGTTPVAASAPHPPAAAQSRGAHARTCAPSARNRTASATTGSTPPRDPYADDNTRISRLPCPQAPASADGSYSTRGVLPQAPRCLVQ
jgi:hypothetical protein